MEESVTQGLDFVAGKYGYRCSLGVRLAVDNFDTESGGDICFSDLRHQLPNNCSRNQCQVMGIRL